MATNNIPWIVKTEWSFESSSYSPTGVSDMSSGSPTVVDLSLAGGSGMADTEAMNSDQVDLGETLPDLLHFKAAIEWFAAISAGGRVEFYWSESGNSAVAAGNPGKPDGVDGDYAGDGAGTVAESVKQMRLIGVLTTTDLQGVQIADIGTIKPTQRYGQLIMVNNSGTTICATDDIESSILMSGLMPDIAAAA